MSKKRIKILHTIRQGTFGGGETYLYNLVTRLDSEKFESVVLSFTEGAMVERLKQAGIQTFVIPTLKPFHIFKYRQVIRLLQDQQVDILHMHGTRAATNTLIPALLNQTKSIYTVHGWSFHTGNHFVVTRGRILSERFLTRFAGLTICGSQADIRKGEKFCPEGKYHLIYNSIDTQEFNPALPIKDIRYEFGLSAHDFVVAFIARFTFQKDPFTFIKAISMVIKKLPQAKFLMVGDGELKEKCIQLAKELNIQTSIVFSPFREDIRNVLQLTDVFVLPSLWEVIPLGLLEAMAMKKACIATHIEGTTEALTDQENGLLIPVHSLEQLAKNIILLANDKPLRAKLQNNARQRVIAQFDIQILVHQNELLYLQLNDSIK